MNNLFIILLAGTFFANFSEARADDIQREYCRAGNQGEMNYCDAERFKQADAEMNRLYREQLAKLKYPSNIARLRDAQRAWIKFRDKVCLYEEGESDENGSAWSSSQSACLTYRTKLRIKDLKEYIACETGSCPH
ncbi:MAG: lysozyme inhibitor LprI family protein [Sideroxydans sp.]|nr:lysozyme inhibitor LprI family protein [Sideroxydans sp.]